MDEICLSQVKDWAFSRHERANHKYANIYPYSLHLNWVASAGRRFLHLAPNEYLCLATCYTHDIIEDARQTYNDVKKVAGIDVAEATFMLTNLRGRNRKERANDEYYEGIRNNPIALFVKPMDRIANMEFGKQFGGTMVDKYRKELPHFIEQLDLDNACGGAYKEIAYYLRTI